MFSLRLAAAGVALLLAGCTSGTTASHHGNASPKPVLAGDSEAGPPPIVLTDTSAARLSLSLRLDVGGFDSTTRDKTEISVMFTSAGRLVRLRGDERITCNGIVVPLHGTTFDLTLPTATFAGRPVNCRYVSGRSEATFTFTAPPAPALVSPVDNARLSRSRKTLVSFRVGGQSSEFYVIAIGPDRKAWTYPEPGVTQVTLNTSAFSPGSGSVALRQSFTLPDLHAPAFHSATGQGDMTQTVVVTWL